MKRAVPLRTGDVIVMQLYRNSSRMTCYLRPALPPLSNGHKWRPHVGPVGADARLGVGGHDAVIIINERAEFVVHLLQYF